MPNVNPFSYVNQIGAKKPAPTAVQQAWNPAPPTPSYAAPPASQGVAVPSPGGAPPDESAARQNAARAATESATRQRQTELNADEDRNRSIQQERERAWAHRQNAVNAGGTASGEYGYAYPAGGGGGASRGNSGGASAPAPAYAEAPFDASGLAALRQQVMPPPVAAPSPVNNTVSDQAFARAKDKSGLLALRRMADSRTAFAQRGMTGGGGEARAMDAVLGDASSGLQDFALGQAQTEATRGYQVADRDYAGALQQRGQDIGMTPTLLALLKASGRAY